MTIQLRDGEIILKKGIANHMVHGMTFIGRLWLTNTRVVFCTRPLNFKQEMLSFPLNEITKVELPTFFYVFNQGLKIFATAKTHETFSVWNRKQWRKEIIEAQKNYSS